jgi:hypothetical protein
MLLMFRNSSGDFILCPELVRDMVKPLSSIGGLCLLKGIAQFVVVYAGIKIDITQRWKYFELSSGV